MCLLSSIYIAFLNSSDQVSTFKGREIPKNKFKYILRIAKTLVEINLLKFLFRVYSKINSR